VADPVSLTGGHQTLVTIDGASATRHKTHVRNKPVTTW